MPPNDWPGLLAVVPTPRIFSDIHMENDMGNVKQFPFMRQQAKRDMGRLKQWAANYYRQPIKDEDDLFNRLQDLLAFVRLGMVDSIFTESDVPPELKATQGVILNAMDYLPGRLARAFALDRYYPEVAASIPDTFTMEGDQ
jgi:hypothetical protein